MMKEISALMLAALVLTSACSVEPSADDQVSDSDMDGAPDAEDNCPNIPNRGQADIDSDGVGDVCDDQDDRDADSDGVRDEVDNCPARENADQADIDSDGVGDVCDTTDDRKIDPLRRINQLLDEYETGGRPPIKVLGLGSSVGQGATLPDPSTQSPVAYFSRVLSKGGEYDVQYHNESIGGSVMIDGGRRFADLDENFDVVLIVYGMNDGATFHYNSGQTLKGHRRELTNLISAVFDSGADPIIVTTPHAHTARTDWRLPSNADQIFPEFIAAPVSGDEMTPSLEDSVVCDQSACFSARHLDVNSDVRRVADAKNAPVISAEQFWFDAVKTYGEDQLFNENERSHPNLLGHEESYHLAIDTFIQDLFANRN